MIRFGLKLWSINKDYSYIAKELYENGKFDYIELYAIPGSFDEYIRYWQNLDIPFIIHAPHFMQGLNFSDPDKELTNMELAEEAFRFADALKAPRVIFHPGIKGDYRESARQMSKLNDERAIVENKPYRVAKAVMGLKEDDICVGHLPDEIKYIKDNANVGFCLDIGHAICAANGVGIDKYEILNEFIKLEPVMFHISDGDSDGLVDKHLHFGEGSYDLRKIASIIGHDPDITIETEKSSDATLDDFVKDREILERYFC